MNYFEEYEHLKNNPVIVTAEKRVLLSLLEIMNKGETRLATKTIDLIGVGDFCYHYKSQHLSSNVSLNGLIDSFFLACLKRYVSKDTDPLVLKYYNLLINKENHTPLEIIDIDNQLRDLMHNSDKVTPFHILYHYSYGVYSNVLYYGICLNNDSSVLKTLELKRQRDAFKFMLNYRILPASF